jgi:5-methylcytosine-specific restriction protein A
VVSRKAGDEVAPRLYGRRWGKARARFLAAHPLCAMCARSGFTVAATVVDHIAPHKGDLSLFWDEGNWQPLCKPCHDRDKQRMERGGKAPLQFTADGRVIW